MKYALVNPNWTFHRSVYFGCAEPHLPLELGYARDLLEQAGHEAIIIDGHLFDLDLGQIRRRVVDFRPDFTVVDTAPTYLFWRCPQPELRVPQQLIRELREIGGTLVAVGPHGSVTPRIVLSKLGLKVLIMGECEEVLPLLADRDWKQIPSLAWQDGAETRLQDGPHAVDVKKLKPLAWPDEWIDRHTHHHHRFDATPIGPGAEVEASRGCPYRCTFCAKEAYRDAYRSRPLEFVLQEIDRLTSQGVNYIYFIDEIFLPNRPLLEALLQRHIKFGIQTRIDLWEPDMLKLLGEAGCVSVEAGVESLDEEQRKMLGKHCRISTEEISKRLIWGKRFIPFMQANLLTSGKDDPKIITRWRKNLRAEGVWANDPVPLYAYPGTPEYRLRWGAPDDHAWERAHEDYLRRFTTFSDIQQEKPAPLHELELPGTGISVEGESGFRVLMTTDSCGGVWDFCVELASALSRLGISTVLATLGMALTQDQRREAAAIPGLILEESLFKVEWMPDSREDVIRSGHWLLELERRFTPDLIHLNGYAHAVLPWRAPTLVTAHSCILSWWQAVHGVPAPESMAQYARDVAAGLKAAQRVTVPSNGLLKALEAIYGRLPKAQVIWNGREASRYHPQEKEAFIFYAGRLWDEAKNIAALEAVAPRLPWPIYLAGGWEKPGGFGRKPVSATCLGTISSEEVARWMARASIFALPARYEPFGLSALEAGLSGCALVLGDIPTLREIWQEAARFVPPGDYNELLETLKALIRDPGELQRLGAAARERALTFSSDRMVRAYRDVYLDLLKRKRTTIVAEKHVAVAPAV